MQKLIACGLLYNGLLSDLLVVLVIAALLNAVCRVLGKQITILQSFLLGVGVLSIWLLGMYVGLLPGLGFSLPLNICRLPL